MDFSVFVGHLRLGLEHQEYITATIPLGILQPGLYQAFLYHGLTVICMGSIDATRVLAAIRVMSRLELVAETVRAALNELATLAPDWLRGVAPVEWYQRYSRRIEDDRLPDSKEKRVAYAQTVGEDGFVLLDLLQGPEAPPQFGQLPSIAALRQVLARHYECVPFP